MIYTLPVQADSAQLLASGVFAAVTSEFCSPFAVVVAVAAVVVVVVVAAVVGGGRLVAVEAASAVLDQGVEEV